MGKILFCATYSNKLADKKCVYALTDNSDGAVSNC